MLHDMYLILALALALPVALYGQETQQAPQPEPATQPQAGELSLTVYSSADPAGFDPQQFIQMQQHGGDPSNVPGFGVVREIRTLDLRQGVNEVAFTDVAEFIDPTTVSITDLTAPEATQVLEQRFQFDLVSPEKLLEKYIDQPVTVQIPMGDGGYDTVRGQLLSINQGQLVLSTDQGLRLLPRDGLQVQLEQLPGGLITRPTLEWQLYTEEPGEHTFRTAYQTEGLTWKADYNLVLGEEETQADLGAWVTLLNLSGKAYENTNLKLIAGDVQRIERPEMMGRGGRYDRLYAVAEAAPAPGFEEKAFFEYHMYTLPRKTTVNQNATQQIALFPTVTGVNVAKQLVYIGEPRFREMSYPSSPITAQQIGGESNRKVDVFLKFENREENELGIPLPRGKVRVYKQDPADGTLEFIGEDLIDHTPATEEVEIKLGQSFDVIGERTQTNFTIDTRRQVMTESFKIELRNGGSEPANVQIKEPLYRWVNWEIVEASEEFEQEDARTITFDVTVPPKDTKTVTYTVRYTW